MEEMLTFNMYSTPSIPLDVTNLNFKGMTFNEFNCTHFRKYLRQNTYQIYMAQIIR